MSLQQRHHDPFFAQFIKQQKMLLGDFKGTSALHSKHDLLPMQPENAIPTSTDVLIHSQRLVYQCSLINTEKKNP